jgi:putative intracellular protease/amidase
LLEGKKATCYSSQEENLKSKGAICTGEGVEVDGNIITANGPKSAREFGKKIVEALK